MPVPVPANSVWHIVLNGLLYDQQCLNVLSYYNTENVSDYAAFADEIASSADGAGSLLETFMACCTADYALVSLDIQAIFPDRLVARHYLATLANKVGSQAGNALPSNVAAVLTKRCDHAGRGFIGSMHVPGCPTTFLNGDEWTVGAKGTLQALANQVPTLQTSPVDGNLVPILFNLLTPANRPEIRTCSVQPTTRVMRRRTKGVGR